MGQHLVSSSWEVIQLECNYKRYFIITFRTRSSIRFTGSLFWKNASPAGSTKPLGTSGEESVHRAKAVSSSSSSSSFSSSSRTEVVMLKYEK